MDALDKLGIICLVFSCLVVLPFLVVIGLRHGDWLLGGMVTIISLPLLWIGGLNTSEFLTKPFAEKNISSIFGWLVAIIICGLVYLVLGGILVVLFRFLQIF